MANWSSRAICIWVMLLAIGLTSLFSPNVAAVPAAAAAPVEYIPPLPKGCTCKVPNGNRCAVTECKVVRPPVKL